MTQDRVTIFNYSIRHPHGIAEDVMAKIDKFSFPVDFVIMNIHEDEKIPLILIWQFLLTSRCNIDLEKCYIILKVLWRGNNIKYVRNIEAWRR